MHRDALEIQFIGNCAFHITDGETAILTDFPYRSGAHGFMRYKMEDVNPVKDTVCLITHRHNDHWSPRAFQALDHAVIGPRNVQKKVKRHQRIPFGPVMTYKDIHIEAIKARHSYSRDHHSYLIAWHGLRIYVTGDAESPRHLIGTKEIDVLLISSALVRTMVRHKLTAGARILILCHQKPNEEVPPFQDYLRMDQGESLHVPFLDA